LERLAAGQMILRANVNERINRHSKLLSAIEQNKDLYAADSALQLTDTERSDVLAMLNGDLYLATKIRLYVLQRLDSELSKGQGLKAIPSTPSYDRKVITVEHVLPQTPPANSTWLTWFPTDDMRQQYTHKLANLVLLARRKNSEAQNYDFDEKKKKYFSMANGVSPFALTSQVLAQSQWTPAVLYDRQKQLVGVLQNLWNL
jgi:hypothetical protein